MPNDYDGHVGCCLKQSKCYNGGFESLIYYSSVSSLKHT